MLPVDAQPGDGVASVQIAEAFVGTAVPDAEIDSLATWLTPDGDTWVIVSAKQAAQVFVYEGDTGRLLQRAGEPGALQRPNGIATFGDVLLVIERDGGRIQMLSLPDFAPMGSFGEGLLALPYGLWLNETAPGDVDVYVTDSYQHGGAVPPLDQLGQRVRRFRLRIDEDPIRAWAIDAFGGTDETSALRRVESIAGDAAFNRLIVAEEHPDYRSAGPLIFTLDGRYTGAHLGEGLFQGDPEGIALYECPSGNGYWIATDQSDTGNRFHVFDRASLAYLGSFHGEQVTSTDGIALHPFASERFPYGVLYVAHDDAAIAAFDWRDIADALNLWLDCPE
ncbi:phytase [Xanthomonadaceae bacterium JHOS43]|nr:phytase [Xanthomonadaceae bacterium JHOS43]